MSLKDRDKYLHLVEFTLTKPYKSGLRKMDDNMRLYAELDTEELTWLRQDLTDLQEVGKIKRFEIVLYNPRDYRGALADICYETRKQDQTK